MCYDRSQREMILQGLLPGADELRVSSLEREILLYPFSFYYIASSLVFSCKNRVGEDVLSVSGGPENGGVQPEMLQTKLNHKFLFLNVGLLRFMVTLQETAKLFSKGAVLFCFPIRNIL